MKMCFEGGLKEGGGDFGVGYFFLLVFPMLCTLALRNVIVLTILFYSLFTVYKLDRRTVCTSETSCRPDGLKMSEGLARQRTV